MVSHPLIINYAAVKLAAATTPAADPEDPKTTDPDVPEAVP